jgi:putative peptide zinc metalloprotease protein
MLPAATTSTSSEHPGGGAPALVEGVELLGEFGGSGYEQTPCLVRRPDGQTLQVTPLLHHVLEAIDGERDPEAIAEAVSETSGRQVSAEDVHYLIEEKLRPLGVLRRADGSAPTVQKLNPLLALKFRVVISNPDVTRRVTTPFARLFRPLVVAVVLVLFAVATGWVLLENGLAPAAREALYEPQLLLLVFFLTFASAGFHEFGHAAACRYGRATPGAMGAGLYLLWPVFYTDVTDAYRLDRRGRLRVDLGGLYFNAVFAVAVFGVWLVTRWEALLLIIPLQLIQMMHQLLPFVRLDGYHILADLTGVPDLFARIKPMLARLKPGARHRGDDQPLKPWVAAVVALWALLMIPILALTVYLIVVTFPRLAATAWDSLTEHWADLVAAWTQGELARVLTETLAILGTAIPVLSAAYLVTRLTRRAAQSTWRRTEGRPVARAAAAVAAALLLVFVARAWWPGPEYRPIEVDERGTLINSLSGPEAAAAGEPSATAAGGQGGEEAVAPLAQPTAGWGEEAVVGIRLPQDSEIPAFDLELLDRLLREWGISVDFDLPEPPGPNDNQVLVLNRQSGTDVTEFEYSIEWVTEGDQVDSINSAYALASCVDCTTVAAAFQVVFLTGSSDTVVPQNVAVAINARCVECVTTAIAVQLVVGLSGPLSEEALAALDPVWDELERLDQEIEGLDPSEILERLRLVEEQLMDILIAHDVLAVVPPGTSTAVDDPAADSTPTTIAAPEPSPTTAAEPVAEPPASTAPTTEAPATTTTAVP